MSAEDGSALSTVGTKVGLYLIDNNKKAHLLAIRLCMKAMRKL